MTAAVIDAVASASRTSPTDMDALYEVVDPDALNALFGPAPTSTVAGPMVEFQYNGMLVQVRPSGDGRVVPYR